jgi:hypothetical protein
LKVEGSEELKVERLKVEGLKELMVEGDASYVEES